MNIRSHLRFILSVCVLLSVGFFTLKQISTSYLAQSPTESSGIEISPPTQELEVDPGQQTSFEVTVRNRGTTSNTFTARIEDFTASGSGGQVALVDDGPWAIANWAQVTPSTFPLDVGEEITITVRLAIPEQNVGGGKYGAVVVGRQGNAGPNAASVAQEIASLFLVRISGPVNENLSIRNLSIPSFVESGPVPMELQLSNTGNIHVKAAGLISITNVFGKNVGNVVIPATNVFPQAIRTIPLSFDKKFLIGPYQTITILTYGSNNKSLTLYQPFFVFPVKIIAGIIIILVMLYFVRRRLQRALKALVGK